MDIDIDRPTVFEIGRRFARKVKAQGLETTCSFDFSLLGLPNCTTARRVPRLMARDFFKIVDLSTLPAAEHAYWHESPTDLDHLARIGQPELIPESARDFLVSTLPETMPIRAWVQVPPTLIDDIDNFASFIAYRLIVRLCTAENVALLRAPYGVAGLETLANARPNAAFESVIFAACNEIEQAHASVTGLILNPFDYWRLSERSDCIEKLEARGVRVARIRAVDSGSALIGDFEFGATLYDSGRSKIGFAEPLAGTFAQPGIALMAENHERLVVNLPANLLRIQFDPDGQE